ncbi:MAG: hypothetical protein K5654_07555 [Lachnospiraceae bacterium]|nr:hypothetical protein [Lachnospiraceae bacterium]
MYEYLFNSAVGFGGLKFYEAIYKGEKYLANVVDYIFMYSNKKINDSSIEEFGGYCTKIQIEELENIYELKMYVTYKGNEYETDRIGPRLEDVELLGRRDHEKEDLNLGFIEEPYYEKTFDKIINRNEIESIRIERKEAYENLLEKYGKENKTKKFIYLVDECIQILNDEIESYQQNTKEDDALKSLESIRSELQKMKANVYQKNYCPQFEKIIWKYFEDCRKDKIWETYRLYKKL